jgi:hypothetical protein
MNIDLANLQQKNPQFSITVDKQSGPTITVTAKPNQATLEVSAPKSVVDVIFDIAEDVALNFPPSVAGVKWVIDDARAEVKAELKPRTSSDTLTLLVPIETIPKKTYTVQTSFVVESLTEDSGANEYAETTDSLEWNSDAFSDASADTTNGGGSKSNRVKLRLPSNAGTGSDTVELEIIRRVGTDGAIYFSTTSSVTIKQIQMTIIES